MILTFDVLLVILKRRLENICESPNWLQVSFFTAVRVGFNNFKARQWCTDF